jgi:hypothetical protein
MPNITGVIKLKCMRWAGHVARMRKKINTGILVEKTEGRDHVKDLGVDGKILVNGSKK